MSSWQLQTAVPDTGALLSIAVPRALSSSDDASDGDPFQWLLTACDVSVPPAVVADLRALAQSEDVRGTAASNVLAARDHYAVVDPYQSPTTPDDRPAIGLDDGTTDAVVLANRLDADGFLTDAFGGTTVALVHAALSGPRVVPTMRFLVDVARAGHASQQSVRSLLETIGSHRGWEDDRYGTRLLEQVD